MFFMSATELAPTEDQGVIFGILDASANSTLDQNTRYAAEVNRAFVSVPETRVHLPDHLPQLRFRRHGREALGSEEARHLPHLARGPAEAPRDSRDQDIPDASAGPPRRRRFSGRIRPGFDGRNPADPGICQPTADEGHREQDVRLSAADRRQDRPARVPIPDRPGQGGLTRAQPGADRRRPGRDGGRQLT